MITLSAEGNGYNKSSVPRANHQHYTEMTLNETLFKDLLYSRKFILDRRYNIHMICLVVLKKMKKMSVQMEIPLFSQRQNVKGWTGQKKMAILHEAPAWEKKEKEKSLCYVPRTKEPSKWGGSLCEHEDHRSRTKVKILKGL